MTSAEIAATALRRAAQRRQRHRQRRRRCLLGAAALSFCLFAAGVVLRAQPFIPPETGTLAGSVSLFGSGSTGAYVLVGVLCFALGVAATLFLLRRRKP